MELKLPSGVNTVAYADDLALIREGKNRDELENNITQSLQKVKQWILTKGLELAPEKTEAIIFNQARKLKCVSIEVVGVTIDLKNLKYLGVMFSKNLNMNDHVRWVTKKSGKNRPRIRKNHA